MRLNNLSITAFRGIRDLELKDFQNVNLLLGGNDAGKTSVLEAILLLDHPMDINHIVFCMLARMPALLSGETQFQMFYNMFPFSKQASKEIEISGDILRKTASVSRFALSGELYQTRRTQSGRTVSQKSRLDMQVFEGQLSYNGKKKKVTVAEDFQYKLSSARMSQKGRMMYLPPAAHLSGFSNPDAYQKKEDERRIVELLQLIEPDTEGIKLLADEHGVQQVLEHRLYGEIPLYAYGDGMKKILMLASAVVKAEGGILMVDEIETSLQASLLSDVFSWLVEACRVSNVQLIATTHSLEAISVLVDCAVKNENSSLACYRLKQTDGQTRVRRFTEKTLNDLVNGSGMDVR